MMSLLKKLVTSTRYLALRLITWGLMACAGLLLFLLSADLLYSSFANTLRPWHTYKLRNEFSARDASPTFTFADYLAKEEILFAEVAQLKSKSFDAALDAKIGRYNPAGSKLTEGFDRDWNRSFVLEAKPQRAVALLLHGLSDSPYSMRSTAQALLAKGITVYGLRLPGHGTIPAGLDQVRFKDWSAALDLTMREISSSRVGAPLYVFGYSTGAALIIKHVADSILAGQIERLPKMMFLYSPALGVTPFARFANVQRLVTGFGILQKARWTNVDLEIDPFKYQSFAKNAGAQLSSMLPGVYESLTHLKARGLSDKLPPIISFQSMVDQTINAADLIGKLYAVVDNPKSELVLFDLNRTSGLEAFLNFSPQAMIDTFRSLSSHNFRLSLVRNESADSLKVIERTYAPASPNFKDVDLHMAWPADIFSLSHIAIPFPPDDQLYGYAAYRDGKRIVNLGSLQMRGEKGVLVLSAADQLRLKSNPFHSYMIEKIVTKIDEEMVHK